MYLVRSVLVAAATLGIAGAAFAHEFWLSPEVYQIERGEPVAVHLRVGENFKGSSHSYFPTNFSRFEFGPTGDLGPADGQLGDRPALTIEPDQDGLWIVVHETTDLRLTYREWAKFERFVTKHDLGNALEVHRERGLPEVGFVETYGRYAKSLIAVGRGEGSDEALGLEVEIVAEANPYLAETDTISVLLLDNGAPRSGAQLEVFTRVGDASDVAPEYLVADDEGRVSVPIVSGSEVLLSFVVLREVDGISQENQPVWRSLWASLTFAVP